MFDTDGLVYVHVERPLDGQLAPGFTPTYPVALVSVDISGTGRALHEWPLPAPRLLPPHGVREYWTLLRALPEGMLLQHRGMDATLFWDLYHPGTGRIETVTDLRAVRVE